MRVDGRPPAPRRFHSGGVRESDREGAIEAALTWGSTYLGAFGLIATQLLSTASSKAWMERHPGQEFSHEDVAEAVAWSEETARFTFAYLVDEGRTLV